MQVGITLLWIIENLVFLKITEFSPYYRLVYSFIYVCLVEPIIHIIHNSRKSIKNAQFIICIAFLIFYVPDPVWSRFFIRLNPITRLLARLRFLVRGYEYLYKSIIQIAVFLFWKRKVTLPSISWLTFYEQLYLAFHNLWLIRFYMHIVFAILSDYHHFCRVYLRYHRRYVGFRKSGCLPK